MLILVAGMDFMAYAHAFTNNIVREPSILAMMILKLRWHWLHGLSADGEASLDGCLIRDHAAITPM